MAQRIIETRAISMEEDGAGGFIFTGGITFVDTTRAGGDRVFTRDVNVPVGLTDTLATFQANRSAAYRAAILAEFGSAPANVILCPFTLA